MLLAHLVETICVSRNDDATDTLGDAPLSSDFAL